MMRAFILKLLAFLLLLGAALLALALLVPPTPRASTSLIFAKLDKDALLRDTPGPRLILVGGSNLSFGIDSRLLKDELGLSPINTAIHANLGLTYMMASVLPYVRPGDLVILAPEYEQFYGDRAYGAQELLRTVIDVDRPSSALLSLRQWAHIAPYLPRFALSKLRPGEYRFMRPAEPGVYERRSFNQYGDATVHWGLEGKPFAPHEPASGRFNDGVVAEIAAFERRVRERGAALYLTFPGFQAASFANMRGQIEQIEAKLRERGLVLLGAPERYAMPERLMFDTPYHLTRQGVELRTRLLIADLRARR